MNIIATIIFASLFVPQGSEDQIVANPLQRGEVAYVNNTTGESFVYVGSGDKLPNRVADESALRGYQYDYLDRSEFVVLGVSNLTRNATSDTLEFSGFATGVTNTFVFTFSIPHHFKFDDVEYSQVIKMPTGSRSIPEDSITKVVSDNIVTITMKDNSDVGLGFTIDGFKVRILRFGDPDYVNDLTQKLIYISDTASDKDDGADIMPLGEWRHYLLHRYDGNRGEDWAYYTPKNNIDISQKKVRFGHDDKKLPLFSVGTYSTNTNVVASLVYGRDAVKYYQSEDTTGATDLKFTSISQGTDTITFTVCVSNTTFDATLLKLFHSDEVLLPDSDWHQIPFTLTSSDPITITASKTNSKKSFYCLSYGDSHVVVEVCDTLKVDRLLLKGDNGSYYSISVNSSGALTATLVE